MPRSSGFLSHGRSALAAIFLLFLAVVLASVPNAQASIYNFTDSLQDNSGNTDLLTAQFVTDSTNTTVVSVSSLTITRPAGTVFAFPAATSTYAVDLSSLVVKNGNLELPPTGYVLINAASSTANVYLWLWNTTTPGHATEDLQVGGSDAILFDGGTQAPTQPAFAIAPDGSWIIATLASTDSTVPEPATLTIWALLGVVGVVYLRRRGAKA